MTEEEEENKLPTLEEYLRKKAWGDYKSNRLAGLRSDADSLYYFNSISHNLDHSEKRLPIPDEDLIILEKVYHRKYPNPGRSRGSLIRIASNYRKYEPDLKTESLFNFLNRKANEQT